jgi:hypothetical protein
MASSSSVPLLSQGQVSELQLAGEYAIKSEAVTPKLGKWAVARLLSDTGRMVDREC